MPLHLRVRIKSIYSLQCRLRNWPFRKRSLPSVAARPVHSTEIGKQASVQCRFNGSFSTTRAYNSVQFMTICAVVK